LAGWRPVQEVYNAFMQDSLHEVYEEYAYAIKKSIVDYIIKSDVERSRLFLSSLEPLLSILVCPPGICIQT
jgi:dynein heavy chain, axonemal